MICIRDFDTLTSDLSGGDKKRLENRIDDAVAELVRQRDALAEACREAERVLSIVQGMVVINRDPGSQECLDQLRSALALIPA